MGCGAAHVSPEELTRAIPLLAACLNASTVRVRALPRRAQALVDLVLRDPFARPVLSPLVKPARQDLWRGVPLAVDEVGATRTVPLIYHSLLVGGLPAAGKSVILTSVVATAGLDPGVDLWLIDPKRVEHRPWVGLATRHEDTVMDDVSGAIQLLCDLRAEIATRTGRLVDEHRKKITPGGGWRLIVLVIDELAELTAAGAASKQQRDEIVGLLRSILALGRAVGVAVVAATQRPAVDTVPAPVRDLFAYRLALRCSTRDQSDTILGAGWASQGFTAAEIRDDHPGEGWLLAEDGAPERVRALYLPDAAIPAVVEAAAELRRPLADVVDLPAAVGPAYEETTA